MQCRADALCCCLSNAIDDRLVSLYRTADSALRSFRSTLSSASASASASSSASRNGQGKDKGKQDQGQGTRQLPLQVPLPISNTSATPLVKPSTGTVTGTGSVIGVGYLSKHSNAVLSPNSVCLSPLIDLLSALQISPFPLTIGR